MDRIEWREEILRVPVFDTHTHLNMPGVPIPAQNFWDIGHYFWFQEELRSVGYPRNAMALPEDERIDRFVAAFGAMRNTTWHMIVRRIFSDLYDVSLSDADSVRRADAIVRTRSQERARSQEADWAQSVVDRLAIRKIAVNNVQHAGFPELPGVGVAVPTWGGFKAWVERIVQAAGPRTMGEQARQAIAQSVAAHAAAGIRGMRVEADPFEFGGLAAVNAPDDCLPAMSPLCKPKFSSRTRCSALSATTGCSRSSSSASSAMSAHARRWRSTIRSASRISIRCSSATPATLNWWSARRRTISTRHSLRASIPTSTWAGCGGTTFRPSTYNHAMQVRFEAVPASKSTIVASDARCIEWCYGKILLVKMLLSDFLHKQIKHGWIDREGALWVAREWLHDAAARRYL